MRVFLLGLCLFVLSVPAYAASSVELLVKYMSFHSLTANFVQTTLDGERVVQRSSGKTWIIRPGYFRWQVQKPQSTLLIVNPTAVWNYDEDLAQATKQSLGKAQGLNAANLLSGDTKRLMKEFAVSSTRHDDTITFTLLPKQKTMFESMTLTFTNNVLNQMQTENAIGQHTVFELSKVKYDQTLNKKLFDFVPPKGVDVLDNG